MTYLEKRGKEKGEIREEKENCNREGGRGKFKDSRSFVENQPVHHKRSYHYIFVTIFVENYSMSSFNPNDWLFQ